MELKVYINTWGRYNEGKTGAWFTLGENDNEDFTELLESKIVDSDAEYFIQDYDSIGFEVSEYDNFFEMNEKLYEIDDYFEDMFLAVCEFEGTASAFEEAENGFEHYYLIDVENEEELGQHLLDEGLMGDIPESIEKYLDVEEIGRDWAMNDTSEFTSFGYIYKV